MVDVLVVSGSGGYADEWHDLPATSARLAALVEGLGHSVRLTEDVEQALADPGPVRLLVLNLGRPPAPRPAEAATAARTGLGQHLAAGGGLLALHATVIALSVVPQLGGILGGAWIDGRSMHPPRSEATLVRAPGVEHPLAASPALRVRDERYSYLEVESDCTVLYEHEHDDLSHPVVWTRSRGPGRIVYDALGHDLASYDSADHADLVRRSVDWLLSSD